MAEPSHIILTAQLFGCRFPQHLFIHTALPDRKATRQGRHRYIDFQNAYRKGDYRNALSYALKANMPRHYAMYLLMTAVYGRRVENTGIRGNGPVIGRLHRPYGRLAVSIGSSRTLTIRSGLFGQCVAG